MLDTWIISDTHLGHKNIVRYCNRPENHNSIIINNWIERVEEDDDILHLGDATIWYGDDQTHWENMLSTLPGKKSLILGNHDKEKPHHYRRLGFNVVQPFVWEGILFNHYPTIPDEFAGKDIDMVIHGHVHNNTHRNVKKHNGVVYVNVSIEVMNYRPYTLREILTHARKW